MAQRTGLLDKGWEVTQCRVFSRWVAKQLSKRGIPFADVTQDFEDGTKLINLLEILGKEDIGGKWNKTPKLRVQMIENCNLAVKYIIEVKKIRMVGIGGSDIVDKNKMLTLGLTWTCINKFMIEDISVEEATARDALLLWCKKNTQGYDGVNVTNFSSSWNTGLAMCALINHFRPANLDYSTLDHADHTANCIKGFEACKELGITVFLDPEDLVTPQPDEKSVVTQVAEFFHFFAADSKLDKQAEKLQRMIVVQKQIQDLLDEYNAQAQAALDAMEKQSQEIANDSFDKSVTGYKGKVVDAIKYGKSGRPEIIELKGKAAGSYAALQLKCRANKRHVPEPSPGLSPADLNNRFDQLDEQVKARRIELMACLQDKIKAYVSQAQKAIDDLNAFEASLEEVTGSLEERKTGLAAKENEVRGMLSIVDELTPQYTELEDAEMHLEIEQTPSLVKSLINNLSNHVNVLLREIDQSIATEKGLEISPEQMEEFRQTFQHFDKDHSNTLEYYELKACLIALEQDASDDECKAIIAQYNGGERSSMTFEEFLKFMLDRFSKAESADTTKDAFRALAQDGPVISSEAIDRFFSPEDAAYLKSQLKEEGTGYDYGSWVDTVYA